MNEQELLDLKHEIENNQEKLAKMEGRKEVLIESLKEQYGVKTIVAAQKKVKALEQQIEHMNFMAKLFSPFERIFGFAKTRYKGLDKNAHRLFVTCALANPKIRLMIRNGCSTFARTRDFVRFLA